MNLDFVRSIIKPYQVEGVNRLCQMKKAFLCDDTGLGKTLESITALEHAQVNKTLIVTISNGRPNWAKEVLYWLQSDKTVSIIEGTGKTKKGEPKANQAPKKPLSILLPDGKRAKVPINDWSADYVIINYDIITARKEDILDYNPNAVIFDESHYLKHSKAKRSKTAKEIAKDRNWVFLLTATPVQNRPADLIHQLQILDVLNEFGGYWYFINTYCKAVTIEIPYFNKARGVWTKRKVQDIRGSNNLDKLHQRLISKRMIRRKKSDVLKDLPDKQRIVIPVQISNWDEYVRAEIDLINFYKSFVLETRRFKASIAGLSPQDRAWRTKEREMSAEQAARRAQELVKIGVLWQLAAKGKLGAIEEWLETTLESPDEKILIFSHHQDVQYGILEMFEKNKELKKYDIDHILAADSQNHRINAQNRFQSDSNLRVLNLSLQGASTNLTLTKGFTVLFPQLYWVPAVLDQAEDRAYGRVNEPHSINAFYFVGMDTIDERMLEITNERRHMASSIIDGQLNPVKVSILKEVKAQYLKIAEESL